jgi:hypothetical protein
LPGHPLQHVVEASGSALDLDLENAAVEIEVAGRTPVHTRPLWAHGMLGQPLGLGG